MSFSAFIVSLAVIAVIFPDDFLMLVDSMTLKARMAWMNTNLLIRSYIIYRKLKSDFERMQLPAPPFRFVPIQNRD